MEGEEERDVWEFRRSGSFPLEGIGILAVLEAERLEKKDGIMVIGCCACVTRCVFPMLWNCERYVQLKSISSCLDLFLFVFLAVNRERQQQCHSSCFKNRRAFAVFTKHRFSLSKENKPKRSTLSLAIATRRFVALQLWSDLIILPFGAAAHIDVIIAS